MYYKNTYAHDSIIMTMKIYVTDIRTYLGIPEMN